MSAQTKALTVPQQVETMLDANRDKIVQMAPKTPGFAIDRIKRLAVGAVNRDPKLQACKPVSVVQAVIRAVELGLEPNGPLGHCYLVPYGDQCQMILGYKGLIALARRSGEIQSIEAYAVHEKDYFGVALGTDGKIDHRPDFTKDRGDAVVFYAVAKLIGGGTQIEVMSLGEVRKIAERTPSRGQSGPWKDHFVEMARKTVVRRLCKYLPLTIEAADALDGDEGPVDVTPVKATLTALPSPVLAEGIESEGAAREMEAVEAKSSKKADKAAPAPASNGEYELLMDRILHSEGDEDDKAVREDIEKAKPRLTTEQYDALVKKAGK